MTAKERIRNILILEEMKRNPKEAMKLGIISNMISAKRKLDVSKEVSK